LIGEIKTWNIKDYLLNIYHIKSTERETSIKFQDESKEEKSGKMTNNDTGEKNELKLIQLKWELKDLQEDNMLRNSIYKGILCFFTKESYDTKAIEEPSIFEQAWCHKDAFEQKKQQDVFKLEFNNMMKNEVWNTKW
jgi:hypothetical protein